MSNEAECPRTAIIAGATQGIGAETARWLAKGGWKIGICGRSSSKLQQVAHDIQSTFGVTVHFQQADISSYEDVQNFSEGSIKQLGAPTLLICNAATLGPIGKISTTDPKLFRDAVQINTVGVFNLIHAYASSMFKQENPRILVLSGGGVGSDSPLGGAYSYAPSKAFCALLVELLSREFEEVDGSIAAIAPGLVGTTFMEEVIRRPDLELPGDLISAARQQHNKSDGHLDLDSFFKTLSTFISPLGRFMNGRIISSKWDTEFDISRKSALNKQSAFRLRRIDETLFQSTTRGFTRITDE